MKVIGSIEDPDVIEKILRHLGRGESAAGEALPRGPPQTPSRVSKEAPGSEDLPSSRRMPSIVAPGFPRFPTAEVGRGGLSFLSAK